MSDPNLCASNDSPWLVCKTCRAAGVCKLTKNDKSELELFREFLRQPDLKTDKLAAYERVYGKHE